MTHLISTWTIRLGPTLPLAIAAFVLGLPLGLGLLRANVVRIRNIFVQIVLGALIIGWTLANLGRWAMAVPLAAVGGGLWLLRRSRGHAQEAPSLLLVAALALGACPFAFWICDEYRRPVPEGIELSSPFAVPMAVGQGGLTSMFNGHAGVESQKYAVDLTRPFTPTDLLWQAMGRHDRMSTFGLPVRSPCRGRIVAAADTLADQPIGVTNVDRVSGNFVTLRCLDTRPPAFVHLAHLRRGSLVVARDDQVAVGDLLGRVGNTGNTTTPHLHIEAWAAEGPESRGGRPLPMFFAGHFPRRPGRLAASE